MCKYKINVKQLVGIIVVSIICCNLNFTTFADSSIAKTYKADTWYKMNDRPSGNEEILSKFPSVLRGIGNIGIRSNDSNKVVTINNCIYMINNDGTVIKYNTVKDTWTSIDKIEGLDESNGLFRLITLNDKIYIIGAKLSDILEYDINKKKCVFITKLPTERRVGAAIGIENKIYILSGAEKGDPNTTKTLDVYDLTSDEWTKKQDMFGGSSDLNVTYSNGKIYTLGVGQDFEEYDIKNDTWTMLSPNPSGIGGLGMEVFNGKIYVFPFRVKDVLKEYNPISNTWISKATMPFEISTFATTLCNGEIYVIDNKNVAKYTIVDRNITNEDINNENDIAQNIESDSENSGAEGNTDNKVGKDDSAESSTQNQIDSGVECNTEKGDNTESNTKNDVDSKLESDEDFNPTSYIEMDEIKIKVNDKLFDFPDAKPFIDTNYRTQVPVKFIGEALGATVSWNGKIRQAIITKGEDTLIFTIGKKEYTFNNQTLKMDTVAMIKQNRTFVPIKYIGEAFGFDISVNMGSNTITLYTSDIAGYTEDGLEIYKINGKEFINTTELQSKYDCSISYDTSKGVIEIYDNPMVAIYDDMDYLKPIIETESFEIHNDFWYFQLDYYENNIKPILSKAKEVNLPSCVKEGVKVYMYDDKEYVLPNEKGLLDDDYLFLHVSDNELKLIKIEEVEGHYTSNIIVSPIPTTPVNGRQMIEFTYYMNNILPEIKKLKIK